ncbi:MAG: rhomboid family intramembrane serine protease [Gemmatimonadetes bacterium]|jgi:membrane associated rhomboid family serine protease|nr:rhomboid family intramembrane serine protease [Gemmatimonadota bacterium]MBP7550007.1 rhomboid family intramembrane serine protease [Gemmatimonadaceae bacterium]
MLVTPRPVSVVRTLRVHAWILGVSVASLWAVFAVDTVLGGALLHFGIVPRTTDGLWGILAAPFLHADLAHLTANTASLLVLGWLVMLRDPRHFGLVAICAMVGAGLVAWLLGAPRSVHVGASGVIFGFLGFLIFAGWWARSFGSILLSLGTTVLWGGLVWGVLPGAPGISWQAHLGGFLGGVLAARWFSRDTSTVARLKKLGLV